MAAQLATLTTFQSALLVMMGFTERQDLARLVLLIASPAQLLTNAHIVISASDLKMVSALITALIHASNAMLKELLVFFVLTVSSSMPITNAR